MAKTIEQLEGAVWPEPEFSSHLVLTIHQLRKKPIDQFGVEDLRIAIGQNVGTYYLMPRALGLLEQTPLVEDYHFPGELLWSVLKLPVDYWSSYPEHLRRTCHIAQLALAEFDKLCERNKAHALKWRGEVLNDKKCLGGAEREVRELAQDFLTHYQ